MPKEIWSRFTGFGYAGQVVTAGLLLAVALLLMFTVFSTLAPVAKPPVEKTVPVAEEIPAVEQNPFIDLQTAEHHMASGTVTQEMSNVAERIDKDTAAASETMVSRNEAVKQLWQGSLIRDFGWQLHPVYKDWRYHNGIDVSGGEGQVVPALLDGEVIDIYTDKHSGLTVVVKSGQYILYYGSLATSALSKNAPVRAGELIGSMGISLAEPEPHLHLAVKKGSPQEYINPREIFPNIPN